MRLSAIVPATDHPPTLPRCLDAIRAADDGPDEVVVVDDLPQSGPAAARNEGARRATGDILVFVDADVETHADVFLRIRSAFEHDPGLTAVFGSYDDRVAGRGLVSSFRDLLHHHVHHRGAGPATTFWAGLGAIRRAAFSGVGGFDEERFRSASVEDVDLGMRLAATGARLLLDPTIQGTHLKRWTLRAMVATDFGRRGVPWVRLLLRHRSWPTSLNLGWRHRLSAAASVLTAGGLVAGKPRVAAGGFVALAALNWTFYKLLGRRCGPTAALALPLHVIHHVAAVASVPVGLVLHVRERRWPAA